MEESVIVDNIKCKLIKEGKTSIYQPSSVFYNPAQEYNRDLSVLVLDTYLENDLWKRSKKANKLSSRSFNVLDALSASGLRGIRYANELKHLNKLDKIYMNDLSSSAIKVMNHNVKFNKLEDKCLIENMDASYLMYKCKYEDRPFLAVDLDPFGCAAGFLDSLVQSTLDGGLLMITATDMAVLCGSTPETCFAKYGSMSMKGSFCHEFALRILLKSIDSAANKYGRYIVPLLSLSIDFYVRVFVQIFVSPNEAKKSANKTSIVYCCSGCRNFELSEFCTHHQNKKSKDALTQIKYSLPIGPPIDRKCTNCGGNYRMAGPIWNSRLHDYDFVEMLKKSLEAGEIKGENLRFNTYRRLKGMLYVVSEELPDSPLFYSLNEIKYALRNPCIPASSFRSAILNAGYQVSQSHSNPDSLKTTAPSNVIWDIMISWHRNNETNGQKVENGEGKEAIEEDTSKKTENDQVESKEEAIETNMTSTSENKNKKGDKNAKREINLMIMNRKIETNVSFEYNPKQLTQSRKLNLLRYQINPTKNWGPGSLPKSELSQIEKRTQNQNKNKLKRKVDCLDNEEGLDEK